MTELHLLLPVGNDWRLSFRLLAAGAYWIAEHYTPRRCQALDRVNVWMP